MCPADHCSEELVQWQKQVKTKPFFREGPWRPEVCSHVVTDRAVGLKNIGCRSWGSRASVGIPAFSLREALSVHHSKEQGPSQGIGVGSCHALTCETADEGLDSLSWAYHQIQGVHQTCGPYTQLLTI